MLGHMSMGHDLVAELYCFSLASGFPQGVHVNLLLGYRYSKQMEIRTG
jgi:hypothetical protein